MPLSVVGLFMLAIASGAMMSTAQKFLSGYSPLLVNAVALGVASLVFAIIYLV